MSETLPTPSSPDYAILHEHRRTDNSFKSIEALEIEYITLTDELIRQMTEPIKFRNKNGETIEALPSKVVFLDKSARPLSWLVSELWDTLAADADSGEIPAKPDFKFLNIDREHWMSQAEINRHARGEGTASEAIGRVSEDKILSLRSVYNHDDPSFETVNEMDHQTILVIDEVKSSGATLDVAQEVIKRAFPESHIAGAHWMSKQNSLGGGAFVNADLPVWYKNDKTEPANEFGRGVGNRLTNEDQLAKEPWKRFLSRRFDEPDQLSLRLREDFEQLATRLKNGDVPYVAGVDRSDDQARMERINKRDYITTMLGYKAIRDADHQK